MLRRCDGREDVRESVHIHGKKKEGGGGGWGEKILDMTRSQMSEETIESELEGGDRMLPDEVRKVKWKEDEKLEAN